MPRRNDCAATWRAHRPGAEHAGRSADLVLLMPHHRFGGPWSVERLTHKIGAIARTAHRAAGSLGLMPRLRDLLTPQKALIFRITHRDNLPWILAVLKIGLLLKR